MYRTIDDTFSNNEISLYRCNTDDVKDIYIAPYGIEMKDDFCVYKEIFYEDDNYTYEFDEKKSDRIFVTAPAVRLSLEKKYTLKEVLDQNLLTIDELENKGLKFNKIAK